MRGRQLQPLQLAPTTRPPIVHGYEAEALPLMPLTDVPLADVNLEVAGDRIFLRQRRIKDTTT
jgi:hypothetical protein